MKLETKNCQNCKKDFVIEPEDFNFYEKMSVPTPTHCFSCRLQRKLAWRNERSLYKRNCDAPGHSETLISMYAPDIKVPIYDQHFWHGDGWDAMDYGVGYDPSRSFFEQWSDLFYSVPMPNVLNINNKDSDYCNFVFDSKNCYLNFASDMNEDTAYLYHSIENRRSFDMLGARKNENCYQMIDSDECFGCEYMTLCENSLNSKFCYDCKNSNSCLGCFGLRNAKFQIFNKQCTQEEYKAELVKLQDRSYKEEFQKKFQELLLKYPRRFSNNRHSVGSTGDYLHGVKNLKESFDVEGPAEDSKFIVYGVTGIKDIYDSFAGGVHFENSYEVINTGLHASKILFSGTVWESLNISYSYFMKNCKDCFGCVGIKNKQYCILNKQYTKDEYEALTKKIIENMKAKKEYGEFFPAYFSPFAYNESVAQQYFPMNENDIGESGYKWRGLEERHYETQISTSELPASAHDTPESIIGKTIACRRAEGNTQCTEAFKIIAEEFRFYKLMNIPVPEFCPNCRHYLRFKQRNPMKLWHRGCMCDKKHQNHNGKCVEEFETSYAPDRPEIVYCEKCYQQEVY